MKSLNELSSNFATLCRKMHSAVTGSSHSQAGQQATVYSSFFSDQESVRDFVVRIKQHIKDVHQFGQDIEYARKNNKRERNQKINLDHQNYKTLALQALDMVRFLMQQSNVFEGKFDDVKNELVNFIAAIPQAGASFTSGISGKYFSREQITKEKLLAEATNSYSLFGKIFHAETWWDYFFGNRALEKLNRMRIPVTQKPSSTINSTAEINRGFSNTPSISTANCATQCGESFQFLIKFKIMMATSIIDAIKELVGYSNKSNEQTSNNVNNTSVEMRKFT